MTLTQAKTERGFSILELLIALTLTLIVMSAATTLLATSLRTRTRENKRSEALTDAQRALSMMSREIGNSGYGLNGNGIAAGDSGSASIRVRADLNNNLILAVADLEADEDVRYVFQSDNRTIVRYSPLPAGNPTTTVMAYDVTFMQLTYYDADGVAITDSSQYGNAERVRVEIRVELPTTGGIPASIVGLVSDVALRNAPNTLEQF